MEKAVPVLPFLMLFMYVLLPAVSLINLLAGYSVLIYSYHAYALITAAVSLIAAVTALFVKDAVITKPAGLCILLMPLLSLINWIFYIFPAGWKFSALCMPFCFTCTLIYMLKNIKQVKRKIIVSVICIMFFMPICFISFLDCIFGSFGIDTVVQEEYSPDGKYKAEVVDSDQGALGGSVIVSSNARPVLDLYFIKVVKKPRCVYSGEWGGYKGMELYWKDSHTLSVNGSEYLAG